ncbi:hypothetical protein AHF37_01725 [Paragonimus kellicotti]|nr:hypothetical protein AHF37_01725 [Paragonimus kellicotti]
MSESEFSGEEFLPKLKRCFPDGSASAASAIQLIAGTNYIRIKKQNNSGTESQRKNQQVRGEFQVFY